MACSGYDCRLGLHLPANHSLPRPEPPVLCLLLQPEVQAAGQALTAAVDNRATDEAAAKAAAILAEARVIKVASLVQVRFIGLRQ